MRFLGRDFASPSRCFRGCRVRGRRGSWPRGNYWPLELRDIRGDGRGSRSRKVDYVLPVFELYRWLPAGVISAYRRLMRGSRRPPLRKFGVSTLIVATRPFDLN